MIKKYLLDKDVSIDLKESVACIGFFDGVHIGHQSLIKKTVELANEYNAEPCLITFSPDPHDVIHSSKTKHINNMSNRIKLFERFGIKNVIIIKFDKDLLNLDYRKFNNLYLKKLSLKALVCGFDFRYGKNAIGDYSSLKHDLEPKCKVYVADEVKYYGKKVSSSRIRNEISKGNFKLANKLLGYKYL